MEWLARLIEQAGRSILAHRLVLLSVMLALLGAIIGWSASRLSVVALGAAMVGIALPFLKITHDRKKRFEKLDEQLPDAIDVMKRAMWSPMAPYIRERERAAPRSAVREAQCARS